MNKYIFVLIVCAVVFLICFLIDTLFKVIFPKSKLEKSKQVVRPPRKSAVAGVILTFAGVAVLIKNLAGTPTRAFSIRRGAAAKRNSATARSGARGACSHAAASIQFSLSAMRRSTSTAPCRT